MCNPRTYRRHQNRCRNDQRETDQVDVTERERRTRRHRQAIMECAQGARHGDHQSERRGRSYGLSHGIAKRAQNRH